MADLSSFGASIGTSVGTSALDQRLSVDVQSVDALRRTARQSPQEGLRQASRQFEALFMGMMLKSMRDAVPSEGMLSSAAEKTYTGMLDQQLTQKLSGRGLGLAEAMYAQLSKNLGAAEAAPAAATTAPPLTLPSATPATATPATATPLTRPALALQAPSQGAALAAPVPTSAALSREAAVYEQVTAQASYSRSALAPGLVDDFVARLMPAAQRASQASGVPAQLIVAQAALESGWGRREPRGAAGEPSFNVFGIKADKSWKGAVVQASTTEYVNGAPQKTQASFRAYGSYDEAFTDYARFLSNPRYSAVRSAPDAAEAAHGLQRAGYATDPDYGSKLVRLMKQMT